jgi:hypothetical protein
MEVKFTASTQFNDFIRKCDNLDFECLKIGTDGTLIQHIKEMEITPKSGWIKGPEPLIYSGYTEDHNEIIQEGKYKCLANTNTIYVKEDVIYSRPSHGTFHNANYGKYGVDYMNENAEARWLDDTNNRYSSFVIEEIKKEIGSKK